MHGQVIKYTPMYQSQGWRQLPKSVCVGGGGGGGRLKSFLKTGKFQGFAVIQI